MLTVGAVVLLLIKWSTGYIQSSGKEPLCLGIECMHGGTLNARTCSCECGKSFGGNTCSIEIHSSRWPTGVYAVPSSVFGCPEAWNYGWETGYVNLSLPKTSPTQHWKMPYQDGIKEAITADPHLLGPYHLRSIQLNFCVKNMTADPQMSNWKPGQYCIYKSGDTCPADFEEGFVTMVGYQFSLSSVSGVLPNISLDFNNSKLTIGFCCRNDGDITEPMQIGLIANEHYPFLLFKRNATSPCQQVHHAVVNEERFTFVDTDSQWQYSGAHPIFHIQEDHTTIGLCYYYSNTKEECYHKEDWGFSYLGTKNTTANGDPCMHWYDVDPQFIPNKRYIGDFDNSNCRKHNPYSSLKLPVCIVNTTGVLEEKECNVSICDETGSLDVAGMHKPVYAVDHYQEFFAENAVDGNIYGDPFQSERPIKKQWFQVDLEEFFEVHYVIIHRRFVWFPSNLRFVSVHISKHKWDFLNYGAIQCEERQFPRKATRFRFDCYRPVVGQYISIRNFDDPDSESNHGNFFRTELSEIRVFGKRTGCGRRLGMISGEIRDFQLSGTSDMNNFLYDQGRLLHPGNGWCTNKLEGVPYYQIDLMVPMVTHGVEIQGWMEGQNSILVEEFSVSLGMNESSLTLYEENGFTRVFEVNDDSPAEVVRRFLFHREMMTRYVRINIMKYSGRPCLKMELLGCQKRVTRDLSCANDSHDFGIEILNRVGFWMEQFDENNTIANVQTISDCWDICSSRGCVLAYLRVTTRAQICTTHFDTRYNLHYYHWWINNLDHLTWCAQQLCIKDISPVDSCTYLISTARNITSPAYPFFYGQLVNCTWKIEFPLGQYIKIKFIDLDLPSTDTKASVTENGVFDMHPGSCVDTLVVRSVNITAGNANEFIDTEMISNSNSMELRLETCARYSRTNARGFYIQIFETDLPSCTPDGSTCRVTCHLNHAFISNPTYPAGYRDDENCYWKIEGRMGQYVNFEFKSLDVADADQSCLDAYVLVHDISLDGSISQLGRYCAFNRLSGKIRSSWHIMHIKFNVDHQTDVTGIKGNGFLAEYEMVDYVQADIEDTSEGCMEGWQYFDYSCYKLVRNTVGLTWVASEQKCQSLGGNLVSLNTRAEMLFIHYMLTGKWSNGSADIVYIGLQKTGKGELLEDFQWVDGSPLTFTSWYKSPLGESLGENQPDGFQNERCTNLQLFSIHSTENWHDVACAFDQINNYICEMPSIVSSPKLRSKLMLPQAVNADMNSSFVFKCPSGEVISSVYICDGVSDCSDGHDEHSCGTDVCPYSSYRCLSGTCISSSMFCDFHVDCPDLSDEQTCIHPDCSDNQWQCTNQQCIPKDYRCDVKIDCIDGSDEENCEICNGESFQCYDQNCIPQSRVCDGFVDCSGRFHEDEPKYCQTNVRRSCGEWWLTGARKNGGYLINAGQEESFLVECVFHESDLKTEVETVVHHQAEDPVLMAQGWINRYLQYSGTEEQILSLLETSTCQQHIQYDCHFDIRDVWWIGHGDVKITLRSNTDNCSCPFVEKCEVGKEKCNCDNTLDGWYGLGPHAWKSDIGDITNHSLLPIQEFHSFLIGSVHFEKIRFLVGPLICVEELNNIGTRNEIFSCKSGKSVNAEVKCLLAFDEYEETVGCRDLSHLENCTTFDCPPGFAKCPDSFCIPTNLMCDNIKHCKDGEDELHCDNITCAGHFKCHNFPICLSLPLVCDSIKHCPEGDDEFLCRTICPSHCSCEGLAIKCVWSRFENTSVLPYDTRRLDFTGSELVFETIDFSVLPYLHHLNLSSCGIRNIGSGSFFELKNLIELDLSSNKITELLAETFKGLKNLRHLYLKENPLVNIHAHAFYDVHKVHELDLSGLHVSVVEAGTFSGLVGLELLKITNNDLYAVHDNSFAELTSLSKLDLRWNKIEEFGPNIYQGLAKLTHLYTDSYAFCCLKPESVLSENCLPYEDEFSSCDDLMRNEVLRAFLWIIGLAALTGNIMVMIVRFIFDRKSLSRTYGIFVSNLSVADFVMGVYLIILAVADIHYRGQYIWNENSWRHGSMCKFIGVLSTIASEGSVLFLLMITIDRYLVIKYPFGHMRITNKRAKVICGAIWILLLVVAAVPLIPGDYFSGKFYSRSAVCLALPLTRDKPPGWEYGVAVFVVFNFVAFVAIAVAQIVIFREIVISTTAVASSKRRQDFTVARNLFLVVITDFLCWFPVGVMGLLALRGYVIPGEVYAWIAVFVLPINSALNPFLYTLAAVISNKAQSTLSRSSTRRGNSFRTKSIRDVFASDLFNFNNPKYEGCHLLETLGRRGIPVEEALHVAIVTARCLAMLHSREMVHGEELFKNVLVTEEDGKIATVTLKSSPRFGDEESDFTKDIGEYGILIRKLIRSCHK